ncbi:MAG: hypothetical protein HY438_04090 [DPANN group archaeon]|nr:hypothetical protein [DPANN group archaeon]
MAKTNPMSAHKLEESLRPGMCSNTGFLGADENLQEVLAADAALLQMLGITHGQIAKALKQKAEAALDATTPLFSKYSMTYRAWMGSQECPWGDGTPSSRDYTLYYEDTKRGISFSGLLPHLISEHNFFEGKGASHRLNPLEAILVLEIPSPKKTKEQIEDMLYQQFIADLSSKYVSATKHALHKLEWFKDRPDFPQTVLKAVSMVRQNKKWEFVYALEYLAEQVPAQVRAQVNEELFGLMDLIDKKTIYGKIAWQGLRKLRRKLTGNAEPNIIHSQYWSDFLEDVKEEQPHEIINICANYVRSRNLLLAEICERGTPFWNEHILEMHSYERDAKSDTEIIASMKKFSEMVENDDMSHCFWMRDRLPCLKNQQTDKQGLEKQLRFYEMFGDLAALHLATSILADNLGKQAEILTKLGQRGKAKALAGQAIEMYKVLARHDVHRTNMYDKNIASLTNM